MLTDPSGKMPLSTAGKDARRHTEHPNNMRDLNEKSAAARRFRISRRTFLRGVGVTMALPWLESIPVWGATPAAIGAAE